MVSRTLCRSAVPSAQVSSLSMTFRTTKEIVEVVRVIRQECIQQRTAEEIVEVLVSQIHGSHQERSQIVDGLVSRVMKEIADVRG